MTEKRFATFEEAEDHADHLNAPDDRLYQVFFVNNPDGDYWIVEEVLDND